MVVVHWIDLYWLIMPEFGGTDGLVLGLIELACSLGLTLVFLASLMTRASQGSLLPLKDPRLAESLSFENT
jgi:hypothetical protein